MEGVKEIKHPVKPSLPEVLKESPIFDTTIVFGQGPIKPVLLNAELSPEQKMQWEKFKKDPLHGMEPEFRVVEGTAYTSQIDNIKQRTDLTDAEKQQLIATERNKWQHMGRFALNRWGRQNALAAGALLVAGDSKELILSGGKTKPKEVEKLIPQNRLENWPSEAELMREIIASRFGDEFIKKYGFPIERAIKIEDSSTNTLENFAYTINNHPHLLKDGVSVGLLGTDFHIRRIAALAHLFTVQEVGGGQLGSQTRLGERAAGNDRYQKILNHMTDAQNNANLRNRNNEEDHWSKELDTDLPYWLGYFGYVKSPQVIQTVLEVLGQPQWVEQAQAEFTKVGLNFNDIKAQDLTKMMEERPEEYEAFRTALVKHVKEFRVVPKIPPLDAKSS